MRPFHARKKQRTFLASPWHPPVPPFFPPHYPTTGPPFAPSLPNVPRSAHARPPSLSAASHLPALHPQNDPVFSNSIPAPTNLAAVFGVTPFGVCCRRCHDPIALSHRAMQHHCKSCHGEGLTSDSIHAFLSSAENEKKRLLLLGNFDQCLVDGASEQFVCSCGTPFPEKKNLNRHCRNPKSRPSCVPENARKETFRQTTCGRFVTKASLQSMADAPRQQSTVASVVTVDVTDFAPTQLALRKCIRPDEDVGPYTAIFHPLVRSAGGNFDTLVENMVDWCDMPVDEHEVVLNQVLNSAETWICHSARRLVDMAPGNLRAGLQVFEGQDVGEINQNYLCNFRHLESTLLPEVHRLLRFVWRHPSTLLSKFKASTNCSHPSLVPDMLQVLFLESVRGFNQHPLVVECCLARCFRKNRSNAPPTMPACGTVASDFATALSILRAGVCSYIILTNVTDEEATHHVGTVRASRAINTMAPMIRRLREMQRRKTNSRMKTISETGDIAVDGFEFKQSQWSTVIPTVTAVCRELLGKLFEGDSWSHFLDTTNPIAVGRRPTGKQAGRFVFCLQKDGFRAQSFDLKPKDSPERKLHLHRLASHVELTFHGFGGGSTRQEELKGLTPFNVNFHRGTFYCETESLKRCTFKSKPSGKKTEHKLPRASTRVYLLCQLLSEDNSLLLPTWPNRQHFMTDAVAEACDFSERPDATQVRHMWTSVSNYVFPDGVNPMITATEEAAEQSGHAAATHAGKCSSKLVGGMERLYRMHHTALGGVDTSNHANSKLTADDLSAALTVLFGRNGKFTSPMQWDIVLNSATVRDKHSHFGLPCGAGKSMAWILPIAAAAISGKKLGAMMVVVPHNFLVCHLEHSAKELLERRFDVSIVSVTTADCSSRTLPEALAEDDHLPDLAFFGVDAIAALLNNHNASMLRWTDQSMIHKLFIDEIHTLFSEIFRPACDYLPELATFGFPIATASATVAGHHVRAVSKYLNLTDGDRKCEDDVDSFHDANLVGSFPPGFTIQCRQGSNFLQKTVERANAVLPQQQPKLALHIICERKSYAKDIFGVTHKKHSAELVTSENAKEESADISERWNQGAFRVLISTTCALVGNENSRCRHAFQVGCLFDLMNVIQAWGRLRPDQRTQTGSIEMFLPKRPEFSLPKFKERDDQQRARLVAKGVLQTNEEIDTFDKVGTSQDLLEWTHYDEGCRIISLHK